MTALDAAARHAGDVHHLLEASFPFAAQVQVVVVELAEQFSAPVRQLVFELAVTERAGLPPARNDSTCSKRSRLALKATCSAGLLSMAGPLHLGLLQR